MTPDKTVQGFKVSEGLEVTLWASEINPLNPTAKEPFMVNPTCMDIDHKGRVWICESVNYRTKLFKKPLKDPKGDRIVVLEDTKGTGQADKATVFYQAPEIHAPMGGVRDSGWGRTGPRSLDDFSDLIWINSHSGQRQYPF